MAAVAFLRIWLVTSQHLTALGGAIYDDRLFLDLADSLLKGDWLGTYNNLTLAKGPFYPFWIAAISKTGLPLLLSQHVLYIASCLLFVIAVKPLLHTPLTVVLVFTLLIFNPMSYSQPMMTQVLRDGIYPSLTMLAVSCAAGLLVRVTAPAMELALWATGLGLSLSAFWLTREEGIWIAPLLFIVVGAAAFRAWRESSSLWNGLSVVVLPLIFAGVLIGCVAGINKSRYGIFTVNELKSAEFLDAYGALLRVKQDEWSPLVPVPRQVRSRIYEASPAFAELRPYLEGDIGKRWLNVMEDVRKLYREDPEYAKKIRVFLDGDPTGIWKRALFSEKKEIMGGWFLWAFREAVGAAGYSSGPSASSYYRRLATEVNAACDRGRLSCLGKRSSPMPPWRNEYASPLVKTFGWAALSVVRFQGVNVQSDPSVGDAQSLQLFRDITHERLSPSEFRVQGWVFSPGRKLALSVVKEDGTPVRESVPFLPSPDVYSHFLSEGVDAANAKDSRFDIRLMPYSGKCYLSLISSGRLIRKIPLDGTVTHLDSDGLHLHIEVLGIADASKRDRMKLQVLDLIGKCYQFFMPIVVILSLIAYAAAAISACRSRRVGISLVIDGALICAIVARLVMLAAIQVTSFPAIVPQYLAPLYPLLILFSALVFADSGPKVGKALHRVKKEAGAR